MWDSIIAQIELVVARNIFLTSVSRSNSWGLLFGCLTAVQVIKSKGSKSLTNYIVTTPSSSKKHLSRQTAPSKLAMHSHKINFLQATHISILFLMTFHLKSMLQYTREHFWRPFICIASMVYSSAPANLNISYPIQSCLLNIKDLFFLCSLFLCRTKSSELKQAPAVMTGPCLASAISRQPGSAQMQLEGGCYGLTRGLFVFCSEPLSNLNINCL